MKALILTNNKYRKFLYWDDLTEVEKEAFDYTEGESFIRFEGYVYLIPDDFIPATGLDIARKRRWDMYQYIDYSYLPYSGEVILIKYNYHKTAVKIGVFIE